MQVLFKEKIDEAISRMKNMGFNRDIVYDFKETGKLYMHEPISGATEITFDDDDLVSAIYKFEQDKNALVFAVVRSYTVFGAIDTLLYVSDSKDDWCNMMQNDELGIRCPAYLYSHEEDDGYFSEVLLSSNGGELTRII